MDTLSDLLPLFRTLWVVWFFVLFLGMLWFVLRPSKKQHFESQADIPLRDDDDAIPAPPWGDVTRSPR
jgi:cytochrome c oxidase cbb3-type subunit 4